MAKEIHIRKPLAVVNSTIMSRQYKKEPCGNVKKKRTERKERLKRLRFKLRWAKPAKRRMDAFSIVVELNVFEDIHAGLFGIVVVGVLNKLSF